MSRTPAKFTAADFARASDEGRMFIYFLRAGQFVKIGKSRNWKQRQQQMQVGSPYDIVPLLVLMDVPDLEKKLHTRFRRDHYRGEWFHMGPAIGSFIKENLPNCVIASGISKMPPVEIVL